MNQQYYLQFCLANRYQPNLQNLNMAYQMAQLSQMMNQNMPQQNMFQNSGNENMQIQGQDINILNNLALLQMMNNGGFGDMNAMMGNNGENNNQDSSQ